MKKKILLTFFILSNITFCYSQWQQIGQDIDGEAELDNFGQSVSLSSDGDIIAIGGPDNEGNGNVSGHVRVYENQSGVWSQIGQDIDGEAEGDRFGESVSLSSNGSILAISSIYNIGNGENSGHVRVYENQSDAWTQIGQDIDGESTGDFSGREISLSSDGNILAIGAPWNDGNGENSGHVRVYENQSGVWTQIGEDIDGETEGDGFGESVSLSSDGTIVAIGAIYNSDYAGHVRVYENQSGAWTQIGEDIDGEAMGDYSGQCVRLSSDGNILAIGAYLNDEIGNASGHVRVYENLSDNWTQIGEDIDGEAAEDQSGGFMDLSSDGTIVVIGAFGNDGNGENSGHVRVYKNLSDVWTQIGEDIDGEAAYDGSGADVNLSSDGTVVAIGAPYNKDNGLNSGHVRVYELTTLSTAEFELSSFKMIPNPAKNQFTIQLQDDQVPKQVKMYNKLGQLVKTVKTNFIKTTNLATGLYYVEVITNQGKATKKLILE